MIFFFGWRSVYIKSFHSESVVCEKCNAKGSIFFHGFTYHFHLFWIPILAYRRKVFVECESCGDRNEFIHSHEIELERKRIIKQIKPRVWQFTGLILLTILIGYGKYESAQNRDIDLSYINSPLIGDIYKTELNHGEYSMNKVVDIKSDTVYVIHNMYATNLKTGIKSINKKENYDPSLVSYFMKDEIKDMYKDSEIFDIIRYK